MTRFAYSAISLESPSGAAITGRREASDEHALREVLRREGMIALDVRPVRLTDAMRHQLSGDRLRRADTEWFFSTLRLMLENSVPIESAMRTMEELSPRPRVRRACAEVREALRAGSSLGDALEAVPGLASPEHLALLRSGQHSGRLDHVVGLIDQSLENSARVRRTVVGRLTYPAILVVAAIGAVWFLAVRVIPEFASTLEKLGGELPWQTRVTLAGAEVATWVVPILAVLAILAWIAREHLLTPPVRARLDRAALRLPVVGTLIAHREGAMITDVVATMLAGGADVLSGLEQAESVVVSPQIAARLGRARRQVREGSDLGEAFGENKVLPPMITAVVRAGIAGGELVDALRRASRLCVERQERITERLLTLLEPAVIVLLAGAVGWVVYSLVTGMMAITNVEGL